LIRTIRSRAAVVLILLSSSLFIIGPSAPIGNAAYTCAQGGTCVVGNTGPGGGRVFYAPGSAFTMTGAPCAATCLYLESAPLTGTYAFNNVTAYGYLGLDHNLGPETATVGAGYANTATLVGISSSPTNAANVAKAYRGSANLSDWFLPSYLEIMAYWNSNPTDSTNYYMASNRNGLSITIVSRGGPYYDYSTNTRPVIPVRAFAPIAAPSISLSQTTLAATVATAVTSYSITSAGGTVGDYSISPNIAVTPGNGISFSTTTGLISGTPIAAATSETYTITATNAGGTSTATFSITVGVGSQTITFPQPGNITLGDVAPSLAATVSSGLTVSYTSTSTSICTVSGSTITVLTAGICSITASQAGNANYGAAANVSKSFTITAPATTNTYVQTPAPAPTKKQPEMVLIADTTTLGWNEVTPIKLTGGVDSGTVTYLNSGSTLCIIDAASNLLVTTSPGTCIVTAVNSGDFEYIWERSNEITINVVADLPTISVIAKKVSIYCIKGKSLKKITGIKPRCPVGYKKKS
jgi:hypothetical protein